MKKASSIRVPLSINVIVFGSNKNYSTGFIWLKRSYQNHYCIDGHEHVQDLDVDLFCLFFRIFRVIAFLFNCPDKTLATPLELQPGPAQRSPNLLPPSASCHATPPRPGQGPAMYEPGLAFTTDHATSNQPWLDSTATRPRHSNSTVA